ncbi:MAG: hypothetical protein JWR26_3399 [Pedosphaera sp.]|nr:hypothetical protein [Pedosphaera sp.]
MRYQLYKLLNFSVGLIPPFLLRHILRALHIRPQLGDRAGYHVFPHTFYNPFPDPTQVDVARLKTKRDLPGVNLSVEKSLELLRELSGFSAEVELFLKNRPGTARQLQLWNWTYPPCDSAALYSMLRRLKPKRYIEVGCGYSSRASAAALKRNAEEGALCEATYIEPYPPAHLAEMKLPGEFIQKRIEQVPLAVFQRLEAGDVLFIDTSHVIKVQNDVEYELIHILPSLKAGVFVHVHDILTPYDYPEDWLVGQSPNRGGNNEQYALECLLSGGGDWEVALPVHLLWREHRSALKALVDSDERPAAFWIKKIHRTGPFVEGAV